MVANVTGMAVLLAEDPELSGRYCQLNTGKGAIEVQLQSLREFNQRHPF